MAEGNVVDAASVKVTPDTSDFRRKLRAELKGIGDAEVDVGADTTKASADISALRKRAEANEIDLKVDVDRSAVSRVASTFGSVASAATQAATGVASISSSLSSAASGSTQLGGSLASAAGGATNIGSSIASAAASMAGMVLQASLISTAVVGIGAAAMIAGGAITAAVGSLPAVLGLVAAPIGAIILGLDGIKKAAKTLQPEFDALKQTVSASFEQGLIPAFEALRGIMPTLQDGLSSVAMSLSGMATSIAQTVSSAEGVQNLRLAFEGIHIALATATPGVNELVASLGRVAGMTGLYRTLGEIIGGFAGGFAAFLDQIRQSGALTAGLDNLKLVLDGVGSALKSISLAALDFFNGAGPGVSQVFTSIGDAMGRIDWAKLGEDLGRVLGALSSAIDSIPPGVFDALAFSFQLLGDAISGLAASGGLDILLYGFAGLVAIGAGVIAFFAGLSGHITGLIGFVSNLASTWSQGWSNMMAALGQFVSWVGSALASLGSTILSSITSMVNSVVSFFQAGWSRAVQVTASAFNSLRQAVSNGINSAVQFVSSLPGRVASALGNLGSLLVNAGRSLIQGFVNGIKSMIGAAVSAAKSAVQAVRNFFPFSPAKEGPFSGRGYTSYSGQALMSDWAKGIASGAGGAVSAVRSAMTATNGVFSSAPVHSMDWSGLTDGLSTVLTTMADTVESAARAIGREISAMTFTPGVELAAGSPSSSSPTNARPSLVTVAPSAGKLQGRPEKSATAGNPEADYAALLNAVTEGVLGGFNGARLSVDGTGLARLVNTTNSRNSRR